MNESVWFYRLLQRTKAVFGRGSRWDNEGEEKLDRRAEEIQQLQGQVYAHLKTEARKMHEVAEETGDASAEAKALMAEEEASRLRERMDRARFADDVAIDVISGMRREGG